MPACTREAVRILEPLRDTALKEALRLALRCALFLGIALFSCRAQDQPKYKRQPHAQELTEVWNYSLSRISVALASTAGPESSLEERLKIRRIHPSCERKRATAYIRPNRRNGRLV